MIQRLPIRWRLTGWTAAFLTIALVVFGLALYGGLRYFLYSNFDEQVHAQAKLALAAIQIEHGRALIPDTAVADLRDDEHFVRLLDINGTPTIDTSAAKRPMPIDTNLVDSALAGHTLFSERQIPGGMMVYVTAPIRDGNTIVGVLQTGASRGDIDELLRLLAFALVIATPLVLAVAVGGGYVLAGHALRPISRITELASGFGAQDLQARLDLQLPDDELGRLARTFDAMLDRIEDAFERQRRFTGDAAHELRTPLSMMRSEVDLALARPRTADEYRAALTEFDTDLVRLTRLVETLLELARADRNDLPLERSWCDLAETITLIADQYAEIAAEHKITLQTRTTPTQASLDEDLIIQLLVNLLDNALASTPPSGTITLSCAPAECGVRIVVQDTGIGIAPEHQARIFERFYRVDAGRTRSRGGTGLGLAICHAIVVAHGGTIALTSEPGQGTTIEVLLPGE